MSKSVGVLSAILVLSVALTAGAHGHFFQSLFTILLVGWLCLTALPISRALLKEDQQSALIFAFPLGYILHSVVLSLISFVAGIHAVTFLIYVAIISALSFLNKPRFSNQRIESAIFICLLVVVGITSWIFLRIGAETPEGFAYRAYFNADFFKHLGITATLSQTGIPPLNPYLSGYVLHYYWFFYVLPAYCSKLFPSLPLQSLLIEFTLLGSLSFVACLYISARKFLKSKAATFLLFALLLFGGSYEGLYGIHHLQEQHQSWRAFTTLNIDALTRWIWQTPQVDTLFRALLYAPQHLLALCMVLLWLIVRKNLQTTKTMILFYAAIFATLGFATIIAILFLFTVLVMLFIDFLRNPNSKSHELIVAVASGVLFLLLYFPVFQMFQSGAHSLSFGLVARIWAHLPGYLMLNWGAILVFGICGIIFSRTDFPRGVLCFFLLLCLFCMHYIKDTVGGSEVTLKLGYVVDLAFLLLSAAFFDWFLERFPTRLPLLITILVLLVLPASATTLIDFYNTQDVRNARFTTYVPKSDQSALDWISRNLPPKTVLQDYGLEGRAANVAVIPPFGQRSVYLGDRFHARAFQVPYSDVDRRESVVWWLFHKNTPQSISAIAQREGIQYLFIRANDSDVPDFRFEMQPPYFSVVFQEDRTLLARVNRVELKPADLKEENSQILFRSETGQPLIRAEFGSGFSSAEGNLKSGLGRTMQNSAELDLRSESQMEGTLQFAAKAFTNSCHLRILNADKTVVDSSLTPQGSAVSVPLKLSAGENRLSFRSDGRIRISEMIFVAGKN